MNQKPQVKFKQTIDMRNLFTCFSNFWSNILGAPHSAPFGTRWKPAGNLHSLSMCAVMFVLLFVVGVGNAWGTTKTTTFTNKSSGTWAQNKNPLPCSSGGWSWASSGTPGGFEGTNSYNRGLSWSSGTSTTLTTTQAGATVTEVSIVASTNGGSSSLAVTVGSTTFKNGNNTSLSIASGLDNANGTYTFSGTAQGEISIAVTNTASKSVWVQAITVTYTSGYTITLNKNGGSTDGSGTVVADATSVTISTAPAKTGYEPEGYYTTSDCATKIATAAGALQPDITVSATTWTNGSSQWKKGGAATFYTNWRAKTYDVTLDRNGATTGSTSVTMTYDSNTHTAITNPTKDGYVFGGYWTGSGGTGTLVINTSGELQANVTNYTGAGGIWTRAIAGTTLYAKWTPTYTVTYNGNGNSDGSVPTDATNYPSGTTVTVKTNSGSLVKTGWTFAGWNANSTGTSTTYAAGSGTFTISSNTTLYAKWTCTVTWSVAGATNVYSDQTITYNPSGSKITSVPTPPNPASYCGDKFVGWTSDENYVHGTSNLFTTVDGSPNLNSIGSTTFYAVFADYDD